MIERGIDECMERKIEWLKRATSGTHPICREEQANDLFSLPPHFLHVAVVSGGCCQRITNNTTSVSGFAAFLSPLGYSRVTLQHRVASDAWPECESQLGMLLFPTSQLHAKPQSLWEWREWSAWHRLHRTRRLLHTKHSFSFSLALALRAARACVCSSPPSPFAALTNPPSGFASIEQENGAIPQRHSRRTHLGPTVPLLQPALICSVPIAPLPTAPFAKSAAYAMVSILAAAVPPAKASFLALSTLREMK